MSKLAQSVKLMLPDHGKASLNLWLNFNENKWRLLLYNLFDTVNKGIYLITPPIVSIV